MSEPKEKQWIAVYTRARAERKVVAKLESIGIECYCPERQQVRQWSDRKKIISVPLIPSYVFVHLPLNLYARVYESELVVKVVTFNTRVAVVRPSEIELLRLACGDGEATLTVTDITNSVGERAEITDGVFAGYTGIVVGKRESSKVAIQIEELGLSVVVTVPTVQVRLKEAI